MLMVNKHYLDNQNFFILENKTEWRVFIVALWELALFPVLVILVSESYLFSNVTSIEKPQDALSCYK